MFGQIMHKALVGSMECSRTDRMSLLWAGTTRRSWLSTTHRKVRGHPHSLSYAQHDSQKGQRASSFSVLCSAQLTERSEGILILCLMLSMTHRKVRGHPHSLSYAQHDSQKGQRASSFSVLCSA